MNAGSPTAFATSASIVEINKLTGLPNRRQLIWRTERTVCEASNWTMLLPPMLILSLSLTFQPSAASNSVALFRSASRRLRTA